MLKSLFMFFSLLGACSAAYADTDTPPAVDHISIVQTSLVPSQYEATHAQGYFTIRNADGVDHLLNGISSPQCTSIVAHHTNQEDTSLTNDLFTHLVLPHNSEMIFPNGSYHFICLGLKAPLVANQKIPFTFNILNGPSVTVSFNVDMKK
ncbi:copper chaperone PCu(A)C [Swingsia samuiensis]|uniref:Copper chaperone PCu(A)C n=1 Tax=Swingsia samuiensis TaxID=1293412 RepID=A0A4Y6UK15_9PROT|nr:copper chaperone PCu(A)C [Swingsia samuiensis]QDH17902.1 copper chaperone PCu(A)C [Swingsia samuiensis]